MSRKGWKEVREYSPKEMALKNMKGVGMRVREIIIITPTYFL